MISQRGEQMDTFIPDTKEREAFVFDVIEQNPHPFAVTSPEGSILYVNMALRQSAGYSSEELIGKDFRILVAGGSVDDSYQNLLISMQRGEEGREDVLCQKKDGGTFWEEVSISPFRNDSDVIIYFIIRKFDITRRKELEIALLESGKKLRELSEKDDLTELLNQRVFWEMIAAETARASRYEQPFCLILFDLDDFKVVNDTYGHAKGDEVLKRVGGVVPSFLRRGIDVAFRYGGEEFAIILPMTEIKKGILVATKILQKLGSLEFFGEEGNPFTLTASVGVVQHTKGETSTVLFGKADRKMYEAKSLGKNQVCS